MATFENLLVDQVLHITGPEPQQLVVATMTITPTGTVIVSTQTSITVQQLTVQDGRDPRGPTARRWNWPCTGSARTGGVSGHRHPRRAGRSRCKRRSRQTRW